MTALAVDHERAALLDEIEGDPELWLLTLFPEYATADLADFQRDYWDWLWSIEPGVRPEAYIGIWFRGAAKSTLAEIGAAALGARRKRRYGLYVSETQEQADDHVGNIGTLLESDIVEECYPDLASRMVGKYGNSKGWRRNRLRTAGGFTIDAIGLDTASRGVKLEEHRPDFLVVDDIDGVLDSSDVTARKVKTLTKSLIPAGSDDLAILAIQNLVHPDSVFAQLADGRARFLSRRHVSGPVPAVDGLAVEQRQGRDVIVGGTPRWVGMDLDRCQAMVEDMGLTAFLEECQHDVQAPPGGMFDHLAFRHCHPDEVPDLERVVVWVDPAVTDTKSSDSMGIQADGLAGGDVYRLRSWEQRATPLAAITKAVEWAFELGADRVGVETDQGGDTWQSVFREAMTAVLAAHPEFAHGPRPRFASEKAGAGHGPKTHRASKMLAGYETGRIVHVLGTHDVLERALRRFPLTKPLDLVDASFWAWRDLVGDAAGRGGVRFRGAA